MHFLFNHIKNNCFLFQFLNRRRISSCQLAPRCTTDTNIDDIHIHDAINYSLLQNNNIYVDIKYRENEYNDGIQIKTCGLTSDDYVESRVQVPYNFSDIPVTNISGIDLTKISSNEVRIY